jgi:hypothetical protein
MDKSRIVRIVLRRPAARFVTRVGASETWSNLVNFGSVQELQGVEKAYCEIETISTIARATTVVVDPPGHVPAYPSALKVEIDVLSHDGFDAAAEGPSRTVGYLQYDNAFSSDILTYSQGNVSYGPFTISRSVANAARWTVTVSDVSGEQLVIPDGFAYEIAVQIWF